MATRPRDTARWVANRINRKTALDLAVPWISWPCIDDLRRYLKPGMKVFEWGAGGSTLFFGHAGCSVVTTESSDYWIGQIQAHVERLGPTVSKRISLNAVPAESGRPDDINAYINMVSRGGPWDVVLVDGLETEYLSRVACVQASMGHIKPGGILVLDDAYRREYDGVSALLKGFKRTEFWGLGPARWGVTKTDVYVVPDGSAKTI